MNETLPRSIDILATSALWYAWGQMDPLPGLNVETNVLRSEGFDTDHGFEFMKLYRQIALEYFNEERSSRVNLIDSWRLFVEAKRAKGIAAVLTVEDIDR
jgi:hypothetical protein